ncbi:tetratricopeptide repeat protein [Kibdelosporangium aridum]|uniref:tetratricopeptide repeat protein n=1 Tax=Kibdelosporangium aridum TaxID=2030 RepID=UPI0035EDBE51
MDRVRVVGVSGPTVPGSGYLVTAALVLTSAHVVGEAGTEVVVFRPGHPDTVRGSVVWRGTPGGRDDAALVRLERAIVDGGVLPRVRWGRLVTNRPGTHGQTWGLPDVVQRRDRPAETVQPSGTINPGDRAVGHRYVLSLDQPPPQGGSPWGGLSGAALFCGDLLTGVIASDPAGWGHARLEAVPAYVLVHDERFRAALAEHADGRIVLEPAEFQHVVEPEYAGLVMSAASLVQPRREIVPFRHRDELLGELLGWAELPGVSVRLVHGPGGQGKTRLARELAGRLPAQWTTVWLDPRATREQLSTVAAAAAPLLVVVDYAESRIDQLDALLEACTRHPTASPIKVLLMARTAGTWWETLPAESAPAQEILDGAAAIPLPPLEPELEGRRAGYRDAVAAFAAALPAVRGHTDIDWLPIAERLPERVVEGAGFQSALTLHMTALADLLDAAYPNVVQDGTGDVIDRLLVHERRYWTMIARARGLDQSLSMETLTDALIAAIVLDAATSVDAHAVLTRVPTLCDQPRTRVDAVRRWIADLYPPVVSARPWDVLQPDLLAERFLGRHIQRQPDFLDHLVIDLAQDPAERLLTLCSRAVGHPILQARLDEWLTSLCVRHHATLALPAVRVIVQVERPGPLIDALHRIVENPAFPVRELEILSDALPASSHVLAAWAADMSGRLAAQHRADNNIPSLATSLHNLSARLIALGRWEESLTAITEAVGLYRTLVADQRDVYLPKLADGLINLAGAMVQQGHGEEGLAASREAVSLYRTLAADQPDEFQLGLADALNGLAADLEDLGQWEEALETITEAVGIHRAFAASWPDAVVPGRAASLGVMARLLHQAGRHDEAMLASSEAVGLHRTLAEAMPDLFRRNLADSLNTVSGLLSDQGRGEEALAAQHEAVGIYRSLAAARPDAVAPDLALLLRNLSNLLVKLDRPEESLAAMTEAVEIRRRLAVATPGAFAAELAESLDILAARHWALGQPRQAMTAFAEAVDISRTLPDVPLFAYRLTNLSNRFAELREAAKAVAASTEAVAIYRRLAAVEPETFLPRLAGSLDNHGMDLEDDGRQEEAVAACTEAVEIYRRLATATPGAFVPELASSLNSLSGRLVHAGQSEAALAAITEAVELRRRLAADRPEEFLPDLATSLGNLSHRLSELNRMDEALAAITEAVEHYRRLAADRPETFLPDLEGSMRNLAYRLAELGRLAQAKAVYTETASFLSTARPDLFPPGSLDA